MSIRSALLAVARLEMLRLIRSPVALSLLFVVPSFQLVLFGTAIRPIGDAITVAVAAPVRSDSETIAVRIRKIAGVRIVRSDLRPGGAEAAVRSGAVLVGVEVPERAALPFPAPNGFRTPLRVVIDASDPTLGEVAAARIEALAKSSDGATDAVDAPLATVEQLYNSNARPEWHYLPALVGVTVMIAMIMLGTLGLAREREGGTWEGLLALPLDRWVLLVGKILPLVLVGTIQGGLVLAASRWLFDVPLRGAIGALILLLPPFAAAHVALGHALAARARTQLAALQGAVAVYLPAMLLSGFLYPFAALPLWAQAVGAWFPLTHFVHAARAATIKGAGTPDVLAAALPIIAFLIGAMALALALQTRRLD